MVQPTAHTALSGPVPAAISDRQPASPGPYMVHTVNSVTHSSLQDPPGGDGGGSVHPGVHTELSGPVPRSSSPRHAVSPGPCRRQEPNSLAHASLQSPWPAGGGGEASMVQPTPHSVLRGPVPAAISDRQPASPGPYSTHTVNSEAQAVLQRPPGGDGDGRTHRASQSAPSGPMPLSISRRHATSPGPCLAHRANSLAHASLQSMAGGGGGDGGRPQPMAHTEPSGPVPPAICARQSASPGPRFLQSANSVSHAVEHATGGGGGGDGGIAQPWAHTVPSGPVPAAIWSRHATKPGPLSLQSANSVSHAVEQAGGGDGGGPPVDPQMRHVRYADSHHVLHSFAGDSGGGGGRGGDGGGAGGE